MEYSKELRKHLDNISYGLVGLGVFLNIFGINFGRNKVLYFAFFVNTLMSTIYLFEVSGERYGIDYIAYI